MRIVTIFAAAVLLAAADVATGFQTDAEAPHDGYVGPTFLISLGGKLYDDLWQVLDQAPPSERNPAFPADDQYTDRDSWRCASCHGWDYSGETIGGWHFPSLRPLSGTESYEIAQRIRDPLHPFPAGQLSELTIDLLAGFISEGQYDSKAFFGPEGEGLGDPEAGQAIFEGACINCHQIDGRRYLQGERGDRSSLGWVVRNRPRQALHKIMNGVPAAEMLSLRFLSDDQIADLVSYLQTLDPGEE